MTRKLGVNEKKFKGMLEKIVTLSIKTIGISLSALILIFLFFFLKETPIYIKILYYFFLLTFVISLAIIICGGLFSAVMYMKNLTKK
jgi:hypothetical protein